MNAPINRPGPKQPDTKIVARPSEIPKCKHWAILLSQHAQVEGYDKGDPSVSKYFLNYVAYFEQSEWEAEIAKLVLSKTEFQALIVEVPTITTTVKVEIK